MSDKVTVGVELDDRSREILKLVVSSYIRSGEPVGSRSISKAIDRRLSPATIRNIMADLEDAGYLYQPHTSAGRVPSERGYRFYVDNLGSFPKPTRSAEAYINRVLSSVTTPEQLMATACHLLSDISQNVGIVVSAPIELSILQHIEFLRLDEHRIVLILVSQSGLVQQKVIRVDEPYTQDELARAGSYLIERFSGCTLTEIRRELVRLMAEERLLYDRMMRSLVETWSRTLDEEPSTVSSESVYVQGTSNILSKVDFSDVARMQELFRMFEEKGRLVKILNECLPPDSEGNVRIMIGSELGAACMRDFTFITSAYSDTDGQTGFMGIIGPSRMEYRKGISVVGYLAEVFGRMIRV